MMEMKSFSFEIFLEEPTVHCKAFKDNSGAIELSQMPKIHPCNKHINFVFCHFHEYICKGLIPIQKGSTNKQCTDAWNKPLS